MSRHRAPIHLSRDPQAISDVDEKEQANSNGDKHNSKIAGKDGCDSWEWVSTE